MAERYGTPQKGVKTTPISLDRENFLIADEGYVNSHNNNNNNENSAAQDGNKQAIWSSNKNSLAMSFAKHEPRLGNLLEENEGIS